MIWLEEYKALTADIGRRVDLQHKNLNLFLVLLSAFAGFIFNYWNDHSFDQLQTGEIAVLFAIAPLLGLFLVWRHLDHDSNIIDKARYLDGHVRPNLVELSGDDGVLMFDRFLVASRPQRTKTQGPLWILGNEHILPIAYVAIYLAFAWHLRLEVPNRAGEADVVFDFVLYGASIIFLGAIIVSGLIVYQYSQIGKESSPLSPEPDEPDEITIAASTSPPATPPRPSIPEAPKVSADTEQTQK